MSTSPPPPPSKAASPSPERVGSIRITDEAREEKALGGDGSSLGHSSPQHQQQKHQQPTSAELLKQEEALVSSNATESTRDIGNPNQDLPFSKARCIALVATVTGASFLNVGGFFTRSAILRFPFLVADWQHNKTAISEMAHASDPRHYRAKQSSSFCPQSDGTLAFPIPGSNGSFLLMRSLLAASCCFGGG